MTICSGRLEILPNLLLDMVFWVGGFSYRARRRALPGRQNGLFQQRLLLSREASRVPGAAIRAVGGGWRGIRQAVRCTWRAVGGTPGERAGTHGAACRVMLRGAGSHCTRNALRYRARSACAPGCDSFSCRFYRNARYRHATCAVDATAKPLLLSCARTVEANPSGFASIRA